MNDSQDPTPTHPLPPGASHAEAVEHLLTTLGITDPLDTRLYEKALTHSSYSYENKLDPFDNYERLEFLGDAVLKLIVSEYLFERFPGYREGDLTKIRAVIVSDGCLAELARGMDLGSYIVFGANEARSGGAKKSSNLACAFEALLGAMFLDGKLQAVRRLLVAMLADVVTQVDLDDTKDNYKAVLQETTQAESGILPQYRTVKESGPAHKRVFSVEVVIDGEVMGFGTGRSKKEAQQHAARTALEALGRIPGPAAKQAAEATKDA
ncbi:MAG: ribonuclease III [Candidatus Melainabacteria bacterium]